MQFINPIPIEEINFEYTRASGPGGQSGYRGSMPWCATKTPYKRYLLVNSSLLRKEHKK